MGGGGVAERLQRALAAGRLSAAELAVLCQAEARDPQRMQALGLKPEQLSEQVVQRFEQLRHCGPALAALGQQLGWPEAQLLTLVWELWLPLALQLIAQRQRLRRSPIQGLLGMQGAGKTTLGLGLTLLLGGLGYRALSLSLDDLYKTHGERLALGQQDPRLIWRGPPGTHDVALGIAVLDRLRAAAPGEAIAIPQFDKALVGGAGDRVGDRWVTDIDMVIFEGWFVGVQPVDPRRFERAPAPLVTAADRAFAIACNQRLGDYLPLWQRLDQLWVLSLSDGQLSKQWRRQAEQRRRAAGRGAMADGEVNAFVDYYQKALHPTLFVEPLTQAGSGARLVIEVGAGHGVERIYRPTG